jgi:uncharacterized protein DUF6551
MKQPVAKDLRVSQLMVDRKVQRGLKAERVRKIAESFNEIALGTVIVSGRTDGTYHIIDGQTRVAAMKQLGMDDDVVSCLVHEGLTLSEEAILFRLHNDTKQVQPITKFLVRVVEGDAKAVQMMRSLTAHGWQVTGATNRGCFSAVAALEWVHDGAGLYEPGNGPACEMVINVLTVAYGLNSDGVRAEMIRGLGLVVLRYGEELDLRKLIVDLSSHDGGALGVIGDAKSLRKIRSDNVANAMAEVLVGMVNKGRRTKRVAEWRSAA